MNSNYLKGRRKEYKIMHEQRDLGCISFRSAGSHSPIDVVSIDTIKHKIKLIQCKPKSLSKNKKQLLIQDNDKLNGLFEVEFVVI